MHSRSQGRLRRLPGEGVDSHSRIVLLHGMTTLHGVLASRVCSVEYDPPETTTRRRHFLGAAEGHHTTCYTAACSDASPSREWSVRRLENRHSSAFICYSHKRKVSVHPRSSSPQCPRYCRTSPRRTVSKSAQAHTQLGTDKIKTHNRRANNHNKHIQPRQPHLPPRPPI